MISAALAAALALTSADALAASVEPMLQTRWGQSDVWQTATPLDAAGAPTYPGCTTVAAAQVLYYYRYQDCSTRRPTGWALTTAPTWSSRWSSLSAPRR